MTPSSCELAFNGTSPREYRARVEWKHPTSATDSSADESLEVEREGDTYPAETHRLRGVEARQEEASNNDEKATTAVIRAIRSNNASDTTPEPGSLGEGRR
jgi:hypothetical protein